MTRRIAWRLFFIPFATLAANFVGFAYARLAQGIQRANNPFGAPPDTSPPISALYAAYARGVLHGDFGTLPTGVGESILNVVLHAATASLGLLVLVFALSTALGFLLGWRAVRVQSASVAPWLVPVSAVGLAMPSFYIGALCLATLIAYLLNAGEGAQTSLPLQGFGWDAHLILPTLALIVRPILQIAHVTSGLLSDELSKPYIIAARSRGNSWRRAQWRHALRNMLAPVILTMAGSLRQLVGELVLVEWLFGWPGLGRWLTLTLVAPIVAGPGGIETGLYFLDAPLVAALLAVFTLVFLLVDLIAVTAVHVVDPRLQVLEADGRHA